MNLQSALLDHWPYKLAALVLAVLLWLNITADRQGDQTAVTRVEFEVQDSAWSLSEAPTEVTTVFQGPRGEMIALLDQPVIRKVIGAVADSVIQVELTPGDVEYDRSLSLRPIAVVPSRVRVRLEPRVGKSVPVRARTDARADAGFVIAGTLVEPESVVVYGPASRVASVDGLETDSVAVGTLREGMTQRVPVTIPATLSDLQVVPGNVSVTVSVDSLLARRFQLQVTAVGAASGSVTLEPASVRVTVAGAAEIVRGLLATDLTATVRVDSAFSTPLRFPVRVTLPPGISARTTAEPSRVTATPAGADGS